ncbi:unnamed protein product, partial [marine sediment metagenome]
TSPQKDLEVEETYNPEEKPAEDEPKPRFKEVMRNGKKCKVRLKPIAK